MRGKVGTFADVRLSRDRYSEIAITICQAKRLAYSASVSPVVSFEGNDWYMDMDYAGKQVGDAATSSEQK